MQGPNVEAIRSLAKASGRTVIASGGVTVQDDLLRLAAHADEGVGGAIVGKALYTGSIELAQAIQAIQADQKPN
ncbi:1-(5-phosphoribosyl)-5-[(5-phosphoribosylamino)methylideneamino] imidazole-4-carboxamide isomerase [compost metagenome]